ncbi:NAD(P)-dependent oxidoreductase [Nocardia terpenica]|uniref:NAD-dependent epimerase/dehydratase family protein n=1 Tax=Nocardia terpenica TaxID=455432 RepID=UPI00189312CC|nr:NAD(P)-dependent oxidoreductase [Nocardia terpenica]MBF6064066.1 NAD(P)-dependent oxidoreductase [Nocardia terpenica]MBF6107698.1 NAD(P)-dependent oxidoreductase [Nocardia terpenica]MBF6114766.1 NAD(P)-dependent oxidoreductase [Nocardia terpenica]MBF6121247.1 NAD(P)-dependent oxidoreductase [Nocardia terpenica]MBF6153211.1 NAD(P)-dependent oxidoreductase [Nocardia terpenica]
MGQGIVLVTGSSGVVGAAVADEMHRAGWQVRGWDMRPGPWTTHLGDLRDAQLRARAIAGADTVVHTAALHAPHVGAVPDAEFRAVNVEATAALLERAAECGVRRLVYTSTTSVYGHALVPDDRAVWVDESLEPRPRDIYDETKLAAEALVRAHRTPATIILRIARCFPEPPAIQAAHRLYRGVDVRDVAAAHRLAAENHEATGTFNIAGPLLFHPADTRRLWLDAPALLTHRSPETAALFHRHAWPIPTGIDRVYDSGKARRELGYHPAYDVTALAATA